MASYVSIHTPTQGVTSCGLCYCILKCFNPHTHAGCDTIKILRKWILRVSIHTPTQGVTPSTIEDEYPYGVSIHTPTQGVTAAGMLASCSNKVSIHTPTQGVTLGQAPAECILCVSIHTPTQGVTPQYDLPLKAVQFQSTHPRRV